MKELKIETIYGSAQAILDVKQTEWLGIIAGSGAFATGSEEYALLAGIGLLISATVKVGNYLSKRDIQRNEKLRDSPYSYLYQMKQHGITC